MVFNAGWREPSFEQLSPVLQCQHTNKGTSTRQKTIIIFYKSTDQHTIDLYDCYFCFLYITYIFPPFEARKSMLIVELAVAFSPETTETIQCNK